MLVRTERDLLTEFSCGYESTHMFAVEFPLSSVSFAVVGEVEALSFLTFRRFAVSLPESSIVDLLGYQNSFKRYCLSKDSFGAVQFCKVAGECEEVNAWYPHG